MEKVNDCQLHVFLRLPVDTGLSLPFWLAHPLLLRAKTYFGQEKEMLI
jgi:hypothetical protein